MSLAETPPHNETESCPWLPALEMYPVLDGYCTPLTQLMDVIGIWDLGYVAKPICTLVLFCFSPCKANDQVK